MPERDEGPAYLAQTLHAAIDELSCRDPRRPAVHAEGRRALDYGGLRANLADAADALAAAGVATGDTVALLMEPSPEAAIAGVAVMGGACAAPLNPALPLPALQEALARIRPRLVIAGEATAGRARAAADRLGIPIAVAEPDGSDRAGAVRLLVTGTHAGDGGSPGGAAPRPRPHDRAVLLPTSGTTGSSKLVALTHAQVLAGARAVATSLSLGPDDVAVHALPMHHVGGIIDVTAAPLLSGGSVFVSVPFSAPAVLRALTGARPTWLQLAPAMLLELLSEQERAGVPRHRLRLVRSVSAPLPRTLLERAEAELGVPVIEIYGMTEAAGVITSNPLHDRRIGTVGVPVAVEVRVVDGGGAGLPAGASGEVVVRGPAVIEGYVAAPGVDVEQPAGDGWLRTGDLGVLDADGYLTLTGRVKDVVNRGGEMISPAAIDRVLLDHPDVADAAAFASPHPSLGEIPAAAVVAVPGRELTAASIQAWVGERLPASMVPHPVLIVDEVPRVDGKLRRSQLASLLRADHARAGEHRSALGSTLAKAWSEALANGGQPVAPESIGPDDDFFALGGDSLRAARLVARLSDLAEDIVYVSAVFDAPTLAGLEEHLRSHYPRAAQALGGPVRPPASDHLVTRTLLDRVRDLCVEPLSPSGRGWTAPSAPNPRAAFILSAPRSGSTLLRSMLAGHPRLFAPPELYLLGYPDLAERSRHFPAPHASQLEGAVRALMEAEGLHADAAAARMGALEASATPTREVYAVLQRAIADRILVDKTPANALSVSTLMRAEQEFDQPVYIHLVRHPSAMVASFVEANLASLWRPRVLGPDRPRHLLDDVTPRQLAEVLWVILNGTIEQFLLQVPDDRVVRLRFEDLVTDSERALGPVCDLLGIDVSPRLLDPYDSAPQRMTDGLHAESRMIGDPKFHRYRRIDASRADRWRSPDAARELSEEARRMASAYGYPDSAGAPGLTSGQSRIWSLARLNPASSVYNVPLSFRIRGSLDILALDQALTAIQHRHRILRAAFPADEHGEPSMVIAPPSPVVAQLTDLRWVRRQNDDATADREIRRLVERCVRRPFSLETGPLWRAEVLQVDVDDHVLALTFHHIIVDGLSRQFLLDELGAAYAAAAAGEPIDLPPVRAQFPEVAARQTAVQAAAAARDRDYWQSRFADPAEPLLLPADHARTPGRGRASSIRVEVPTAAMLSIDGYSRQHSTTPTAVWLATVAAVLHRWTGQQDLLLCVPTSGRHSAEAQTVVGYLNRIVPVRLRLTGDSALGEVADQARTRLVEAIDHDAIPLQDLAALPGMARTSLNAALVSYHSLPDRLLSLADLDLDPFPVRKDASDFDLVVNIEQTASALALLVDYNADLIGDATASALASALVDAASALAAAPDRLVSAVVPAPFPVTAVAAALASHPGVDDCVVRSRPGSGMLDAYLVLNEFEVPTMGEVLEHARESLPAYRVPETLTPIDHIPIRTDGSPDLAALPAADRAARLGSITLPRDDLERWIADAWRSALWTDREIGVHESFRDIGGHSLLSVQVVTLLEERLGRRIPSHALLRMDTIAGLADALREAPVDPASDAEAPTAGHGLPEEILSGLLAHTATWTGVRHTDGAVTVGLNTDGTRLALFWCLQNNREHEALAAHLGPDQPVYGLRSGHRIMVKSDENIALLARHYVDEILEIQPQGPYVLGGNCQASRIAIRIANHLRALGHAVPLLFMMEKFDPVDYNGPVTMLFGDRSDRNPYREFTVPEAGFRKRYRGPLWIREMSGEHGHFFVEPNIQSLAGIISQHLAGLVDPAALPPPVTAPDGPPPVLLGSSACRARFELAAEPRVAPRPETGSPALVEVDAVVTNVSAEPWPAGPAAGVAVGCRWRARGSATAERVASLDPLRESVPVGHSLPVSFTIPVPGDDGTWILEADVVEQGVAWFQDRGSTPLRAEFEIRDGAVAVSRLTGGELDG